MILYDLSIIIDLQAGHEVNNDVHLLGLSTGHIDNRHLLRGKGFEDKKWLSSSLTRAVTVLRKGRDQPNVIEVPVQDVTEKAQSSVAGGAAQSLPCLRRSECGCFAGRVLHGP